MKKNIFILSLVVCGLSFSCKNTESSIAVLWSSKPEFARYCEVFNASQKKYKIVAHYVENPSKELLNQDLKNGDKPDLIVDCWLKGIAVRNNFINLNSLLKGSIEAENFYSELLQLGKNENEQLLLPVSFNLPVIIFKKGSVNTADEFSISLDDLQKISARFNYIENNSFIKMGFAPIWNTEFLYLLTKGFNANFEENGNFFSWNENSIAEAVSALRKFTLETNTSTKAETDFQFKYLYNNAYSAVMSGRCLFQYLRSDQLFMLDANKSSNIDFRWVTFDRKVPLDDEVIYAGVFKGSKNKGAAKAFLVFLFSPETQKAILKENSKTKLSTLGFGVAGGFSSLRSITENYFPTHYPLLLSHLPQSKNFMSPNVLPSDWLEIKRETIIPYLKSACEIFPDEDLTNFDSLGNYINASKIKRE